MFKCNCNGDKAYKLIIGQKSYMDSYGRLHPYTKGLNNEVNDLKKEIDVLTREILKLKAVVNELVDDYYEKNK